MVLLVSVVGCVLSETVEEATVRIHNEIRRQEATAEHGGDIYELVSYYSALYSIWGEYQIQFVCVSVCVCVHVCVSVSSYSCPMIDLRC